MKNLILAAVAAFSTAGAAQAADITAGQRQFNLECRAKGLGAPVRQTASIDLDQGRAWFVERNVGSNANPTVFPVVVANGKIDLKGDRDELQNWVKLNNGMWMFHEKGFGIFGVCKVAPYTPIPEGAS